MPGERMTDHKFACLGDAKTNAEEAVGELDNIVEWEQDNPNEGEIEETLSNVAKRLQDSLSTVRWVIRRIR